MCRFIGIFIFIYIVVFQVVNTTTLSRQKRCIVIQKQSGTHGDSTEGEDERQEEPRKPDQHHDKKYGSRHDLQDAEEISPEFLRYKTGKTKNLNDLLRLRNKLNKSKYLSRF